MQFLSRDYCPRFWLSSKHTLGLDIKRHINHLNFRSHESILTNGQKLISDFLITFILLSCFLVLLNLIPLPPLDGGQIAITFYELVTNEAIEDKKLSFVHSVGFLSIIFLAISIVVLKILFV